MAYAEQDLIIPALRIIQRYPDGIRSSELIKQMIREMKPEGEDMQLLAGRKDTRFSQKVRNLKSHNNLVGKGLAQYEKTSPRDGMWRITSAGRRYLTENAPVLDALERQGFNRQKIRKEIKNDFKGLIVEEGALTTVTTKQRKRSAMLRRLKTQEVKANHGGKLPCAACGFDFERTYNGVGQDFIHIHHTEPVHTMDIGGSATSVEDALKKVEPLCSNCHSMVHRQRDRLLSIPELRRIIAEQERGQERRARP